MASKAKRATASTSGFALLTLMPNGVVYYGRRDEEEGAVAGIRPDVLVSDSGKTMLALDSDGVARVFERKPTTWELYDLPGEDHCMRDFPVEFWGGWHEEYSRPAEVLDPHSMPPMCS